MVSTMTSGSRERLSYAVGIASVALLVLIAWWLFSLWLFVVPPPLTTLGNLVQIQDDLGTAAKFTFGNAAISFGLAVFVGTILGIVIGRSSYWYRALSPIIIVSGAVPKIIIYPILLLFFGLGPLSVISMGFIGGIFSILINVMAAVRNIKPVYVKVGRSLNIGPLRAMYRIYLPAVLLAFLTGVRLSFGLTLVNVVFAELFASEGGMGKVIMKYYSLGQFTNMMSMIFVLFIVASIGSMILWGIERRVQDVTT